MAMTRGILIAAAFALMGALTASAQKKDTVTEDKMNKGYVSNGLDALNGQSAGVTISSGANREAMLSAVRVRGTTSLTGGNDPLVIIDGVSSDLSTLSTVYPADIESFTILKDAAETAQYGSRGASGVIEVTTKKGQQGAFQIRYDGNVGFESVYRNLKMLSAEEFRSYGRTHGLDYLDGGHDSDMPASIVRKGFVQNHHIAFGGGSDNSFYRASIGIMDRSTVIKTNGYKNYTAKLDVSENAFNGILHVDLGVFGSLQKSSSLHDMQHLFYSSAAFNPTYPAGSNPDGTYSQIPAASQINHPVSLLEKQYDEDNAHFNTHILLTAALAEGLTLKAFGSYSYKVIDQSHFFPTIVWSHGEAYRGEEKAQDLFGNVSLGYARKAGRHQFDFLVLAEAQKNVRDGFYTTATNFTTDAFGYHAIQAGAARLWNGTASYYEDPRMASFMGSVNYSFSDRYIFTFNARADASSKFGANHRWGFFPSVSGSWAAVKEPFLEQADWLSNLRFNVGYGRSGNQDALGSYNSMQLVKPNGVVEYDGTQAVTFGVVRNANPDLKWEVRTSANAGVESAFLRGRIVFTAEWYYSKTTDMLYEYEVSVPPFAYNKLMANLGEMDNSGLEFGLGVTPLEKEDMELNINVNLSLQRNRLISLSGYYQGEYIEAPEMKAIATLNGAGFHGGDNDIVYQAVGQPLGVFWLPHCNGLIQSEDGTYMYDIEEEKYIAGQATPKAMVGSNVSFRYRDFDVSMQINGAFGHKIYNGTSLTYMNMASLPYYNVLAEAPQKNIADQRISDYWLEDGDYVNIDYVTVGWNVPLKWPFVKNFRISASVNNLVTFTKYSGLTPMINSSVMNATFGLDDKISFPVYRSYTMGLSVQF